MAEELKEATRILNDSSLMNQNIDYVIHKSIDDDDFTAQVKAGKYKGLTAPISPIQSLTYYATEEERYARIAALSGEILIWECYADERNHEEIQTLSGIQNIGNVRITDSRRGFKQNAINEKRIRIENTPQPEKEKKKWWNPF